MVQDPEPGDDPSFPGTADLQPPHRHRPGRRLVLRIYERTADRLLINTYYTSKQNPEEIYAGTIHLERYDMAQTMESFSYMGIIDLLMLQTDSQILA